MRDKPKILIVEDEPLMGALLAISLDREGYEPVGPANRAATALHFVSAHDIQAAILDFYIGSGTVAELAWQLYRRGIPIILYSSADWTLVSRDLPPGTTPIPKGHYTELLGALASLPGV